MKRIFYLLLVPAFAFILPSGKEAIVKGSMKLIIPVEWIYLRYSTAGIGGWLTDSSLVVNGEFRFKPNITDVNQAELYIRQ